MQLINEFQLETIYQKGQILVNAKRGPKVLENRENEIVKVFVPRKHISSAIFSPYARRFARNSQRLLAAGVRTINVKEVLYCKERKTYLVVYPKVPGYEVRQLVSSGKLEIFLQVSKFLAELHDKGIFFRGIHLGNLLLQTDNELCLLDIVNLKMSPKPLSLRKRMRNIKHLLACKDDKTSFKEYGVNKFIEDYLSFTTMTNFQKQYLRFWISRKK